MANSLVDYSGFALNSTLSCSEGKFFFTFPNYSLFTFIVMAGIILAGWSLIKIKDVQNLKNTFKLPSVVRNISY